MGIGGTKAKGYRVSFWGDGNVPEVTAKTVTNISEHTKNHWIVYTEWVNCIVPEFYPNRAILKKDF